MILAVSQSFVSRWKSGLQSVPKKNSPFLRSVTESVSFLFPFCDGGLAIVSSKSFLQIKASRLTRVAISSLERGAPHFKQLFFIYAPLLSPDPHKPTMTQPDPL